MAGEEEFPCQTTGVKRFDRLDIERKTTMDVQRGGEQTFVCSR